MWWCSEHGPGGLTDGQCVKSAWIWVAEPGPLSTQLNSTFQSNYCLVQWNQGRILTCFLSLCCFSLSFLFLKWMYLAEYFSRKSKVCDYNQMNNLEPQNPHKSHLFITCYCFCLFQKSLLHLLLSDTIWPVWSCGLNNKNSCFSDFLRLLNVFH